MAVYDLLARAVSLVGAGAILLRGQQGHAAGQAVGTAPQIPPARPQGSLPTLKMPTAQGWAPGQLPQAAAGLKVNAFASGLKQPALAAGAAQRRRDRGRSAAVRRPAPHLVRPRDGGHHAPCRRAG